MYHPEILTNDTEKQLFIQRYTNADLKISLYILNHVKVIQWKFRILNRKNSQVIYP